MASIVWSDVVAFFAAQSTVETDAQDAILAHVNTALDVSYLGGESGPKLRLARIYLAAHYGELATPFEQGDDVASKTVGVDSFSVSYAGVLPPDQLAATAGGQLFSQLMMTTPARLGFVTGVC